MGTEENKPQNTEPAQNPPTQPKEQVPVKEEKAKPLSNMFSLEIAPDHMQAIIHVDVVHSYLSELSPTHIYNFLTNSEIDQKVVDFTIINHLMNEINQIRNGHSKETHLTRIAAKGILPTPGIDGWIKFYFPHNQRVVIHEDGKADYRNIDKYISIKQDEKIATIFQGVSGKPGKDIYGNEIQPPSILRPRLEVGKNISTKDYYLPEEPEKIFTDFIASCDGALFTTADSVSISPELKIETNVGISTGNINYDGTIEVRGSIEEGAKVSCTGVLSIGENVESHDIIVGKDLIVKSGIKLKAKGAIKVGGNLRTKFIENAIVEIEGDLIVEGYILNSKIFCLGSVLMTGQTSSIIGTEIIVFGGLSTYNLGSNAGLDVMIEMGFHFKNERLYNDLVQTIKNYEKEIAGYVPQVQQANYMIRQSRGKLDNEKKRKFKQLFDIFQKKSKELKTLLFKAEEVKTNRFNTDKINLAVKGAAYPGVTIKYRRQVEKITVTQSSFMMNFFPGQDHAPMTAISSSGSKKK